MLSEPIPPIPEQPFPEPLRPRSRFLKKRKPLTCIIAQKSKNGVVMVADTRVLKGYQASEEAKILELSNGVLIGASGHKFMVDDFIPLIAKETEPKDFTAYVQKVEDIVGELYKRYRPRIGYDWQGFSVLVVGLDGLSKGKPRIRLVLEQGYSEEIETFEVIGHASDFAIPFIKMLFHEGITTRQMWKSAYFAIGLIESLELDVSVGGIPDTYILKADSKPRKYRYEDAVKDNEGAIFDYLHYDWSELTSWYLQTISFIPWDMAVFKEHFKTAAELTAFMEKMSEEDKRGREEEQRKRKVKGSSR